MEIPDSGGGGGGPTTAGAVATNPTGTNALFQQPFDSRALHFPLAKGKLQRGFMYQKDSLLGTQRPLGLRFLFNPESVVTNYSINTDVYPTYAQPGSGALTKALVGVPGSATFSFSLLFDRTYDCWGPHRGVGDSPSRRGVYHDVGQLERMLGYTAASPFVTIVGMQVFFGKGGLQYYGYITGFDVEYTTWTQDMRPIRCGVNFQFTVLPSTSGGGSYLKDVNVDSSTTDTTTTSTTPSTKTTPPTPSPTPTPTPGNGRGGKTETP